MKLIKLGCERMYYGEGAVQGLADLPAERKRAYIVMSGTIQQELGQLDIVTDVLEKAGFVWKAFTDVEPDPDFESVRRGAEDMAGFEPDWIIGFGGGSAMDAALAMWVYYEHPEMRELADSLKPDAIKNMRNKARFACIPTSAGTGSEATRAAVITDKKLKQKFAIRCMQSYTVPDIAILEPAFSVSMPKGLTVGSGMDAITHAVEAYTTPLANVFSDAVAIQGFRLGFENLEECYKNPNNMEARSKMLASAYLAGVAFANCGLGIAHGIAHTFGAQYHVPHGLANAITLPYVLKFNEQHPATVKRYEDLAYFIRQPSLYDAIVKLNSSLDVPQSMKEVVKQDADVKERLSELADIAMSDICTKISPLVPTKEQMMELIEKIYFGK